MNYKEKILMKFNTTQLDKIIIALLNNSFNKKFANNVQRLFSMFRDDSFKNDYEKLTIKDIGTKYLVPYYKDGWKLLGIDYDTRYIKEEKI